MMYVVQIWKTLSPLLTLRHYRIGYLWLLSIPMFASAQNGVYPDRIVFGQTAVFSGPAQALGKAMHNGLLAAFAGVNQNGGIHGRQLVLRSYDDGYEPDEAAANTRRLLSEDPVFALIGSVGTPTSRAILPIVIEHKVPLIGPFTGAAFLRTPEQRYVINVRASYAQETEQWIRYLVDEQGLRRIAVFYQDDSFGQAGLKGIKQALRKRGMRLVARGSYARNLTAVHSALFTIRKAQPDAVAIVGAYRPAAEFIRLALSMDMQPLFINISFVGTSALVQELGEDRAGVIVTQVVPSPWNNSLPLVAQYQRDLASIDPNATPNHVSLEGYIVGRLTMAVLSTLPDTLTRENFLNQFYRQGEFHLGGFTLRYSPGDNQGSDRVYLTVIQADGSVHTLPATGTQQ